MEASLQRLFSTFASGWPGVGLLLLRLTVAAVLLYCAAAEFRVTPHLPSIIPQTIGAAAGIFLLIGFGTPFAGVAVALVELWFSFFGDGFSLSALLLTAIATSLAMIGPGAWSLDARLFGRKHIEGSAR